MIHIFDTLHLGRPGIIAVTALETSARPRPFRHRRGLDFREYCRGHAHGRLYA